MAAPGTDGPFSFSRIATFRQCPLRYRYRYLEGLEEAFRPVETFLGSIVHDVLEWVYRERDGGAPPPPEAAAERFAALWAGRWTDDIAVVRVNETPERYRGRGLAMVQRFVREVLPRDRSETTGLERRFTRRLGDGLLFTGIADRTGRTAAGTPFVVDYKTSARGPRAGQPVDGLQARLYAACLLDETPAASEARAGFHYLATGRTRWETLRREEVPAVWERFGSLVREIVGAAEYPPRPGTLCAWCGFNGRCPAARVPGRLSGGLRLALARRGGDGDPGGGGVSGS